jgi:multidrug efflux pump
MGIAIVGGLIFSQMLTLYTTPVVYLYLDRFRIWCSRFRKTPAEISPLVTRGWTGSVKRSKTR